MSQTASIAAVGPSHWTFMATVMATSLDRFIENREVVSDAIPEGVYNGVKEFFELVLDATGENRPKARPVNLNAYVIATDALRGSIAPLSEANQDLLVRLKRYSSFVDSLERTHAIDDTDELETARSLRDFFRSLAQEGEAESYMQTIQANHASPGFPFIR